MKKSPKKKRLEKLAGTAKPVGPIKRDEEVQQSNDEHIDQDFPGFPHHPSQEKTISNDADGSEMPSEGHDGSANAFEGTENTRDDKDIEEDQDDRTPDRPRY
jgi:hypothetical protein